MALTRDFALALQYGLPHRFLSRLMYYFMRSEIGWLKNAQIAMIAKRFKVDCSDALEPDMRAYPSFNAFFTRALRPNARPLSNAPWVMPADGAISQLGPIEQGRMLQAKGMHYDASELLGDAALAERFAQGSFATVYLSPRDYHRVHMPIAGRLLRTLHIPGRLFSVATWTAESIPRLFARNERLVCVFETEQGLMALVLVGAIFVSSIETVFDGQTTPPYAPRILEKDFAERAQAITLAQGAEMGRFNMGSTVIVLSETALSFAPELAAATPVKMGQALAL
jgi:phosphatidylserine decarboxylase